MLSLHDSSPDLAVGCREDTDCAMLSTFPGAAIGVRRSAVARFRKRATRIRDGYVSSCSPTGLLVPARESSGRCGQESACLARPYPRRAQKDLATTLYSVSLKAVARQPGYKCKRGRWCEHLDTGGARPLRLARGVDLEQLQERLRPLVQRFEARCGPSDLLSCWAQEGAACSVIVPRGQR